MSNLAYALKEAPDIAGLVKQVIIMGGAFDVPGNITPAAEANIHGAVITTSGLTSPCRR